MILHKPALTFEEDEVQENHERVFGDLLQAVRHLPVGLLPHVVINPPPGGSRIREVSGKSKRSIQLPDAIQKLLPGLQLLVQKQGVAYFQFKFGAGQVKGVDEALEAPVDVGLWGLREVEAETLQDLSRGVSSGPQREQGQGGRDAHGGEEDVSWGFSCQLLIQTQSKVGNGGCDFVVGGGRLRELTSERLRHPQTLIATGRKGLTVDGGQDSCSQQPQPRWPHPLKTRH